MVVHLKNERLQYSKSPTHAQEMRGRAAVALPPQVASAAKAGKGRAMIRGLKRTAAPNIGVLKNA